MKRLLSKFLSAFLIITLILAQVARADDTTNINPNIYNIPDKEKISFTDDTKYKYGLIHLDIDGIEYAPGANYFSPSITIKTHSSLGIVSSSERHSLSHGKCKNFSLIAKRICVRNTIPGTHGNNNFPDGYTGPLTANNATVKPQYVKLCAFYDPFGGSGVTDLEAYKAYKSGYIDIMDSDMDSQVYHEGDKANPASGSMEAISEGAFNLAMVTAAPFVIGGLAAFSAATAGLALLVIGILKALQEILKPFLKWLESQPFNRIVKETIGCYPIPYSPSPPPFCPTMVVPHKIPELFKICSAITYPPSINSPTNDGNICEEAVTGIDSKGNKKILYNTFENPVVRAGFKERVFVCSRSVANSNSESAKKMIGALQDVNYCLSSLGGITQDQYGDYKKLFDTTSMIFGCQSPFAVGNICLDKAQVCTAVAADGVTCTQYVDTDFHQQESGFRPLYEISYQKSDNSFIPSGMYVSWFDTKIGTNGAPQPNPTNKLDFVGVEIGSYTDLQSHAEGTKIYPSSTKKLVQENNEMTVYSKLDGAAKSDGSNSDSSNICVYGKTDGDDKYLELGCMPRPQMPLPIVLGRVGADGCRTSKTVNTIYGPKTVAIQGFLTINQDRICQSTHRDPLLQVSLGFDEDMQSDILGSQISGSSKNSTVLHGVTLKTFILDSNFNKIDPGVISSEVQFDSNGNYIRGGSKLCVGGYVPPAREVVVARNNANSRSSNYNTKTSNSGSEAAGINIATASVNPVDRILPPYSASETMPIAAYNQILTTNTNLSTDASMVLAGSNVPSSMKHDGNVINNMVDHNFETVRPLTPYEYGLCVDIPAPSCASETRLGVLWPTSKIGAVVKMQCPGGGDVKYLTRKCNWLSADQDDGKWGDPKGTCGSNTCPVITNGDETVYIAETDQNTSAAAFCKYNARVTSPMVKCNPDLKQPKWEVDDPTEGVSCKCLMKQACACAPALYPTSLFQIDGSTGNMVDWANLGASSSDWCDIYTQNQDIFNSIATNTPDDKMTYGYIDQVQDRSVVDIYVKRGDGYHLVAQNVQNFPATKILIYYRSKNSILYYFTPRVTIVDSSNNTFSKDYTGYVSTKDYSVSGDAESGGDYYYKLSDSSLSNLTKVPYGYVMSAAPLADDNPKNSDYEKIDAAVNGLSIGDSTQNVRLFGQGIYIAKIPSAAR